MFYKKRIEELEENERMLVEIVGKQTTLLKQLPMFINFASEKMDDSLARIKYLELKSSQKYAAKKKRK